MNEQNEGALVWDLGAVHAESAPKTAEVSIFSM